MRALALLVIPLGVLAAPLATTDEPATEQIQKQIVEALKDFGTPDFKWPSLELRILRALNEKEGEAEEFVNPEESIAEFKGLLDAAYTRLGKQEGQSEGTSNPEVEVQEEEVSTETPVTDELIIDLPKLVVTTSDNSMDMARDAYLNQEFDSSEPVCSHFQHAILGEDYGAKLFPRISYVASSPKPFRVHYADDDNLRYESFQRPFAACMHGCALQELAIRAMLDRELDPTDSESTIDEPTKQDLRLAREICEWKNVHHHFNFASPPASPKRMVKREISVGEGLGEIEAIFASAKSPQDLAAMFKVVAMACKVHKYCPDVAQLQIADLPTMVNQAMAQVSRVFAATQGRYPNWETRDAIVRACTIYRYQEENGLLE